ncbi:MAG: sulfur carrier protein ThiS [Proteobacteria bacterium]|nr:sulfur carrier protein ThiS [Pseudomonadota bacterium]
MISITLNGQAHQTKSKSILELIRELDLDIKKIAIEQNYQIVLHEDFANSNIKENDQIEIVHFIGGG